MDTPEMGRAEPAPPRVDPRDRKGFRGGDGGGGAPLPGMPWALILLMLAFAAAVLLFLRATAPLDPPEADLEL